MHLARDGPASSFGLLAQHRPASDNADIDNNRGRFLSKSVKIPQTLISAIFNGSRGASPSSDRLKR
jgi:hypothetical protein